MLKKLLGQEACIKLTLERPDRYLPSSTWWYDREATTDFTLIHNKQPKHLNSTDYLHEGTQQINILHFGHSNSIAEDRT